MFSTITTAPSTRMPKSIAPIDSRFAGMCWRSRQMNANSSDSGIVTATISPDADVVEEENQDDDDEHDAAQRDCRATVCVVSAMRSLRS